jgi:hypothetical protein
LSVCIDLHNALHPDVYDIFQYKTAADPFATSCEGVSFDEGEAAGHQPGPEAASPPETLPGPLSGRG